MKVKSRATLQVALIGAGILFVTALHLITPLDTILLHEIYQRLYYIPILAAAVLFGLRGGLLAALFASLAYLPHILLHWHHTNEIYALNQYAEIAVFHLVGAVTGVLGDRSRAARRRSERTAEELQKAYTELRQTFEQLLQADRLTSLGELSAGVVHEIRNPLASIKGAVEILEDELARESPRREFAEIAKREIERLNSLVEEFLRFARPSKPATALADINEIARSVAALTEQQATREGISVKEELAEELPRVALDREQIKQVLLNLTINAIQAMPGGGRVMLRTFSDGNENVTVEVEDEGGGVDSGVAARIFDPFFTTKEKGVGLGLSIAHRITAQHGGMLTVTRGERGAIFRLSLPINQEQSS